MKKPVKMVIMEPVNIIQSAIYDYISFYYPSRIIIVRMVRSLYELRTFMMHNTFDFILTDLYGENENLNDWLIFNKLLCQYWKNKKCLVWTDIPEYYLRYVRAHMAMPHSFRKSIKLDVFAIMLNEVIMEESMRKEYQSSSTQQPEINILTYRETLVLDMFFQGKSITNIAHQLGRSVKTISAHKRNAMRKLGVTSNIQLMKLNQQMVPGYFIK